MPRIRKKTSKRGTTHQRTKIKHKVAESRKKAKKEAKKNPQWKSKHKKDPGIPNNFPYKDQVLAEVAEQRRQEEEARRLKKEKKAQKKAETERNESDDEQPTFDGITNVRSSTIDASIGFSSKGKAKAEVDDDGSDEDVPILMNNEYHDLRAVLEKADVVLQVLDARDPLAYASTELQKFVKNKPGGRLIYVINKIDTTPRESVQGWLSLLRKDHLALPFRSASAFLPAQDEKGRNTASKRDGAGTDVLLKALKSEAAKKKDGKLVVAIVGVANTGKSSLLNSILQKTTSPVYKLTSAPPSPSTTERPLEVPFEYEGQQIIFIDTPALSWERSEVSSSEEIAKIRSRDLLLRSKGRIDRAKDPIAPVADIVSRAEPEDLMLFYTLPAFRKGDDTAFLSALARKHNFIKKGGDPDLQSAARIVLRDWNSGKFPRYAQPPKVEASTTTAGDFVELYAMDETALSVAPTRKEMRKGHGLVKLVPGTLDSRKIVMDEPWDASDEDEESEQEGEDEDVPLDDNAEGDDAEDSDEDEEDGSDELHDEDEDGEEEDESSVPSLSGKRKRGDKPAKPAKKVLFAPEPKGTKASRAQPKNQISRSLKKRK